MVFPKNIRGLIEYFFEIERNIIEIFQNDEVLEIWILDGIINRNLTEKNNYYYLDKPDEAVECIWRDYSEVYYLNLHDLSNQPVGQKLLKYVIMWRISVLYPLYTSTWKSYKMLNDGSFIGNYSI